MSVFNAPVGSQSHSPEQLLLLQIQRPLDTSRTPSASLAVAQPGQHG
jgi:hypothetical protein